MSGAHDSLFKKSFENPEVAAAHFRDSLPADAAPLLDLSKLRLEPGSFVDDTLKDRHSDLLFWVPLVDANAEHGPRSDGEATERERRALLFLLFEHQSTVDHMMPFRILSYETRIWERWLSDNPGARSLPPIFPLVLYNGRRRWSAPVCLEHLLDMPVDLRTPLQEFLPRQRIVLQWLRDFEPDELPGDLHGRLVLSFLREHGANDMFPFYRDHILAVKDLPMPERLQVFRRLLHYSCMVSKTSDHDAYVDVAALVGPEAKEFAMTYGERLIAQGVTQALQKTKLAIVDVLESRGLRVSADARNHIAACDDFDVALAWHARCRTVESVGELFEH